MDAYYFNQASVIPHFSGPIKQSGSGFGALVAGIGRVALPIIRKFILPTAKRVGRELLTQSVPEIVDVISKRKTPKEALKRTLSKTAKAQIGGAPAKKARRKRRKTKPSAISRKKSSKRSRLSFFSKVNGY